MEKIKSLVDENFNILKLNALTDSLKSIEHRNQQLLEENRNLKDNLTAQKDAQADIYHYLHKKLDDNYEVISRLEAHLLTAKEDQVASEKDYGKRKLVYVLLMLNNTTLNFITSEEKIKEVRRKHSEEIAKISESNIDLNSRITELRKFITEKEMMERKLLELSNTIEFERKEKEEVKLKIIH